MVVAIPSDAATVMLLRPCREEGVKDIETLLVRRNRKSSFVPGYHVFPGGVIDPADYEAGIDRFIPSVTREEAGRILPDMSVFEKALGAWVAGIRETFEEVGVLLARKKDGAPVTIITEEECRRFGNYRQKLIKGEIRFSQILEAEKLVLAGDRLHYFSHWITPEPLPLRYDVRFFLTEAPEGQHAVCDGVELTSHVWLRPSEALRDYEAGKIDMVLPQIMTIAEISRFSTVDEALTSTENRVVKAHLTKLKNLEGKDVEIMPDGVLFKGRPPVYSRSEPEK